MVLHRQPDGTLKNMHIAHYPDLALMFSSIEFPSSSSDPHQAEIVITYKPPPGDPGKEERTIRLPLLPDVHELRELQVVMHKSPTKALDMGPRYNAFLSDCLGYDVVLAYLGPHLRPVLMSSLANSVATDPSATPSSSSSSASLSQGQQHQTGGSGGGWLSSLATKLPTAVTGILGYPAEQETDSITFADCAPYLVVSDKSLEDVSSRLPAGEDMDITKFRPNIIVSGADEAWEEDFWAELVIGGGKEDGEGEGEGDGVKMRCLHNCARCVSINIGECFLLSCHLGRAQRKGKEEEKERKGKRKGKEEEMEKEEKRKGNPDLVNGSQHDSNRLRNRQTWPRRKRQHAQAPAKGPPHRQRRQIQSRLWTLCIPGSRL